MLVVVYGRSCKSRDARISSMPGRSMWGFHRPSRRCAGERDGGGGGGGSENSFFFHVGVMVSCNFFYRNGTRGKVCAALVGGGGGSQGASLPQELPNA